MAGLPPACSWGAAATTFALASEVLNFLSYSSPLPPSEPVVLRTCKIDGFATGVVSDPRYVADAGGPDGSRVYPFGGLHGLLLITAVVSTSVKTALSLAAAKSSDGLLHYTGRNPDGSTADYTLLIREDTTTYEVFAQPPANPVTGIHSRSITRAEVAAAADILGLSVLSE